MVNVTIRKISIFAAFRHHGRSFRHLLLLVVGRVWLWWWTRTGAAAGSITGGRVWRKASLRTDELCSNQHVAVARSPVSCGCWQPFTGRGEEGGGSLETLLKLEWPHLSFACFCSFSFHLFLFVHLHSHDGSRCHRWCRLP